VVGAVLQHQLATEMSTRAAQAAPRVGKALAAGHVPAQAAARIKTSFLQTIEHASSQGFHLGRGQSGGAGLSPLHLPAAVANQLNAIGEDIFRHAYVNAMKPSLTVPICVIAFGALVTMFLDTRRQTPEAETAPGPAKTGVAVAGE
jgi:hypothetical protein